MFSGVLSAVKLSEKVCRPIWASRSASAGREWRTVMVGSVMVSLLTPNGIILFSFWTN
jgi:hypothetical protein